MSKPVFTQQFTFDTAQGSLMPLTSQVLDAAAVQLQNHAGLEDVLFRAKYIVIELLTNAWKHSGATEAHLSLVITADELRIVKTDLGHPLPLLQTVFANQPGRTRIAADVMHALYAAASGTEIRFMCEEKVWEDIDINQLPEHFGLLIITKTADEFLYHYQKPDNVFTAIIRLA